MMAWSSYAYAASGWDAALVAFVNFETTFSIPYLSAPLRIPRGSVTSKALDGSERSDGWREIVLQQLGDPNGVTLKADLNAYVTAVFGGWSGDETAEIAIKTRDIDDTFKSFNVLAFMPQVGTSFEFNPMDSRYVNDLKLRFLIVAAYTPA